MNIKEFSARHSVALFYSTIVLLVLFVGVACMAMSHRGFGSNRGNFGNRGGVMMQNGQGRMMRGSGQYQGQAVNGQPTDQQALPPAGGAAAPTSAGAGVSIPANQ